MKKNIYFLGICILLISTNVLAISTSIASALTTYNNDEEISKQILKDLPNIAQDLAWDTNGNPICIETADQDYIEMCSDGEGGAIITWRDERNGEYDIFAQRIDADGNALWTENGITICTANDRQMTPKICSDGEGGAIITWRDDREITSESDIYAQHINSNGQVQWEANGKAICTDVKDQEYPEICSDGAGGAIITWDDERIGDNDIYAQHINSDGNLLWEANGTVICNAVDHQDHPKLCSDGAGGAIITWYDDREATNEPDIYAQHINSGGVIQWGNNGTAICIANDDQYYPEICNDGTGGAVIVWEDERSTSIDIYAQHIYSNGTIHWGVSGTAICTADNDQKGLAIYSNGVNGAIITWEDERSDDGDVYAQYIDLDGVWKWTSDGIAVSTGNLEERTPMICSDGGGGVIITWENYYNYTVSSVSAQRINSNGIGQWGANGTVICDEVDCQRYPIISSDDLGGAIIAWQDKRNGVDFDIYAQRINNPAPTSNHPADIETTTEGTETINWTLSDDSGGGQYRVLANLTGGSDSVVRSWTSWINGSVLHVPINRTSTGFFEYTIEYYDDQNQFGVPDMVIVQITESKSTINGYSIFILSLSICLIGLIFTIRLTRKKNLMN